MPSPSNAAKYVSMICQSLADAMASDPWTRLPPPERVDCFSELLSALLQVALGTGDAASPRADVLDLAREHGRRRGFRGFNEEAIFEEYYLIRRETYSTLHSLYSEARLERVILRLDAAISAATLASLRGLHGRGTEGL